MRKSISLSSSYTRSTTTLMQYPTHASPVQCMCFSPTAVFSGPIQYTVTRVAVPELRLVGEFAILHADVMGLDAFSVLDLDMITINALWLRVIGRICKLGAQRFQSTWKACLLRSSIGIT
jgi:hypothetical protein